MVAVVAGGAGRESRAAFALANSSPLSWQGEEGQIGPAGLNSSEGPKVSASVCRRVPWFPMGCPRPRVEGRDVATLPVSSSMGPNAQGTASPCPPGRVPSLLPPTTLRPASLFPLRLRADLLKWQQLDESPLSSLALGETCRVA